MISVLLAIGAICTAVVLFAVCLLLAALGHDKPAMAAGAVGVLLPILMIVRCFL